MKYRAILLSPSANAARMAEICVREHLDECGPARRYIEVPMLAVIVDEHGLPVESATLFLAKHSLQSRGATGSTVRTYSECLVCWFRYLTTKNLHYEAATEEDLQLYRAMLNQASDKSLGHRFSTATANLRVAVVAEFHKWCQGNGFPSALGRYLIGRTDADRALRTRVIRRHPRALSIDEVKRLFIVARDPYKLVFRWALVTGMRRFEVLSLRIRDLPQPEELALQSDGMARIQVLRKGGKEATVYAPVALIEATQWFVLTERPLANVNSLIFLGPGGRPMSAQSVSKEFRRCADVIGTRATLHHLRHTFAVHVLSQIADGGGRNALKTVQVLLGHSSAKTTEIYCESLSVTEPHVVSALSYLYGACS